MNAREAPRNLWRPGVELTSDLNIAIVCDTQANGHRGMNICQSLIDRFNREFLFQVTICPLDTFSDSGGDSPALRRASRATLVLLVTATLPPERFWNWLDHWSSGRHLRPIWLGALSGGAAAPEIDSRLQHFCQSRAIDLITMPDTGPAKAPPLYQLEERFDEYARSTPTHHPLDDGG